MSPSDLVHLIHTPSFWQDDHNLEMPLWRLDVAPATYQKGAIDRIAPPVEGRLIKLDDVADPTYDRVRFVPVIDGRLCRAQRRTLFGHGHVRLYADRDDALRAYRDSLDYAIRLVRVTRERIDNGLYNQELALMSARDELERTFSST